MIRRLLIPLLGSGLLLAASAGSALAKCEGPNPPDFCSQVVASIDFGSTGSTIQAGTETTMRVWVTRGEQPTAIRSVALTLSHIGDATVVNLTATMVEPGLWKTTVKLPLAGAWTVRADVTDVDGNISTLNLDAVNAAPAVTAPQPPATTPPATPVNPTPPALPIALLVAGLAGAALLAGGMRERARRRDAGATMGASANSASGERA
ncbi:MAG: hypothetical protein M3R32_01350 [Chloroflexota bacterium]|nr:hypothetical protein [Chloroflexota bacterium]